MSLARAPLRHGCGARLHLSSVLRPCSRRPTLVCPLTLWTLIAIALGCLVPLGISWLNHQELLREVMPLLQGARVRWYGVEGQLYGNLARVRVISGDKRSKDRTEIKVWLGSADFPLDLMLTSLPDRAELAELAPKHATDFEKAFMMLGAPAAVLPRLFDAELRVELLVRRPDHVHVRRGWLIYTCAGRPVGDELHAHMRLAAQTREHILSTVEEAADAARERARHRRGGVYRGIPGAPDTLWKDEVVAFRRERQTREWMLAGVVLLILLGLVGGGALLVKLLP